MADVQTGSEVDLEAVISSIRTLAGELDAQAPTPRIVGIVAQLEAQLSLLSASVPSSVGTCEYDGKPLRYQGRDDGLYVCCSRGHCWPVQGRSASP